MSMSIEILPESEYLRIMASGNFTLEDAGRTFLEILEAVAEHKAKKVLVDGRNLTGTPADFERFFYGRFIAQAFKEFILNRGVSANTRFAYVLLEPLHDPARFGETVAVNRGVNILTFDNLEDALKWFDRTQEDFHS